MSNSIPFDPSALQDQSKLLRRISSKASNVASAVSVIATPHYEASTRSVDDDLDQPIVVEKVIPSSFKHTSADNDNHQGKYISMVTDPTISRLIDDNNSSNVNMIETKQSLSNIFSEIDVLTSPISVAIKPTNTSSDLIVSTTTASQSIEPTIGTIANEQVVSKEEQDKSALAARLKAKLEEKAYMIPSFSNLLIDPYNPSTDPYNSNAGTEQVNNGSTTNTSINNRKNPVPTSEPIKVSSASTYDQLELGELSPTSARSRSSTPDKMSARKSSKKSKKNYIISSNVSDDGMGDNTEISASTTNDTNKISRNNSSNSMASSTPSTPNRKSSVSKRGGENDRDVSSSSSTQVTALDSPGVGGVVAKRASMAGPKVRNIKDLKIKVRPTEPLRSGYLHKLDMNLLPIDGAEHEEEEEEAWTTQYVTMDVPTGQLEYFTEINR